MQWWCSGTLHFAHMRRALTLSLPTTVHCLQLRLLGLPLVLRWHNPVAQAVKSRLVSGAAADPPPDGHGAILAKQLQDQLPQEVQEGLLVACGLWKKRCSLFHKILSHLLLVFFYRKNRFLPACGVSMHSQCWCSDSMHTCWTTTSFSCWGPCSKISAKLHFIVHKHVSPDLYCTLLYCTVPVAGDHVKDVLVHSPHLAVVVLNHFRDEYLSNKNVSINNKYQYFFLTMQSFTSDSLRFFWLTVGTCTMYIFLCQSSDNLFKSYLDLLPLCLREPCSSRQLVAGNVHRLVILPAD